MARLHEPPSPRRRARITRAGARLVAVAGFAWLGAAAALAGDADRAAAPAVAPTAIVLRGEVMDTACFVIGGRKGLEHRQCALACARSGQELGVLDEKTKTLFVSVLDFREEQPKNPLLPYVADRVQVRGMRVDRGGLPAVIVQSVEKLSSAR